MALYAFLDYETSFKHVALIMDHKELRKPASEQICSEYQDR